MRSLLASLMLTLTGSALVAQSEPPAQPPGLYLILDGSGSMWGQLADGSAKIETARRVLEEFVGGDFTGQELALRVYGHRREGDCADSQLVVPFSPPAEAAAAVKSFAATVKPKGKTPISRSLRAALEDFGGRRGEIVLISDGIETCDEDPCELMRLWREKDVAIRVHVVGLGLGGEERQAMQCIAEAAGTEYRDAQSAGELGARLAEIRQAAVWQVLDVVATNSAGERLPVSGSAVTARGETVAVRSGSHNRVPPGTAEVTVGVETANGNLYRPVSRSVEVGTRGVTTLEVVLPEPPSVRARFLESGEERPGSVVEGFQGERRVLAFRPADRVYVDPGSYTFRTRLDQDNELEVAESFAEGDHKTIAFEALRTVHVRISMKAAGSGLPFPANLELWRDGERIYTVHRVNGATVRPGRYDVRLPLRLTPWTHAGLDIGTDAEQVFDLEIPAGHVTARYQRADGTPDDDARYFLERDEAGKLQRDGISHTGERIPLVPGRYRAQGWSAKGKVDPVVFEIAAGEEKEIVLRSKE